MMYMNTYSNERFNNVPLTAEQFDVIDFIAFEEGTSVTYPFAIGFDDVTMDMVEKIIKYCNGHTHNEDFVYEGCEYVLGINQELLK